MRCCPPRGRHGALWAADRASGTILVHDGTRWTTTGGRSVSVDAGADGSVICVGLGEAAEHNLYRWQGDRWQGVYQGPNRLTQVAAGDANRVWVPDQGGSVYRFDGHQLTADPLVPASTHITATRPMARSGVVTGVRRKPSASYRKRKGRRKAIDAAGVVQRNASTDFGTAHCQVRRDDNSIQLYRYTSPYVFKTS